jgi:NADH-quinone oxidoreductase subunit J
MSTVDFLFWVFAILSVGGGLSMILSRHPVSAAMFMIVSLVGVAALFVILESFFLAVLQVLVYAGAVMVLFLFIIMLLDVGPGASKINLSNWKSGLVGFGCTCLLVGIFFSLNSSSADLVANEQMWPKIPDASTLSSTKSLVFSTEVSAFGYGLMTKYMLPVQISGFLLLAAMIGVIILSKKGDTNQDI